MKPLLFSFATLWLSTSLALAMPPLGGGEKHEGYGQALPSEDLPLGVLTVKVVAGGNMAHSNVGAKVELIEVSSAGERVQFTTPTGSDGRARFEGLLAGKTYRARVKGVGASTARSQMVTMPQQGGIRLLLSTPSAAASGPAQAASSAPAKMQSGSIGKTRDLSVVSLISGTHLLGQVGEDVVQFMQVLVLRNASKQLFDPGAGLVFPIPHGAQHARLGEGSQGKLRVAEDGNSLMLVSPLPPGRVTLRFTYQMSFDSPRLDFLQVFPVRRETTLLAITNNQMVDLQGPAILRKEQREQGGGNQLPVYVLRPEAAKGALEFTLMGLPHRDQRLRNATIGIALFLVIWGIFGVASGGRRTRVLMAQRERLLDELAALMGRHEAGDLPDERFAEDRAALLQKLRTTWSA